MTATHFTAMPGLRATYLQDVPEPPEFIPPPVKYGRLWRRLRHQEKLCRRKHRWQMFSGKFGKIPRQVALADCLIQLPSLQPVMTLDFAADVIRSAASDEISLEQFACVYLGACYNEIAQALQELSKGDKTRARAYLAGPYKMHRFRDCMSPLRT